MRLKISFPKEIQHNDVVTSVGWNNTEEIFSCGDDHVLIKCSLVTSETQKVCELPVDVFPIDFHTFSKNISKKQVQELLLITSSDGRFHLIGKSGRIEKSVDAHKGAVLVGQWSHDGSSLLTGGEDGAIKIWSRSGMLRSTVAQGNVPVYTACWSPDITQVLYSQGKSLIIKPLAPNTKPNRWRAHDGLILRAAWDQVNGNIISGGEDCKYKVWDCFGRQLYSSIFHEHPITSLAWSPSGSLFAVGSYNTLRLCDKTGWSHHLEKPLTGSLYSISWSPDGTQLAAACSNHRILVAHLIGRKVEWGQYEAESVSKKTVLVQDVSSGKQDKVECPERVIHLGLAYKHLAVVTSSQCYIYPVANISTPTIIDLREGSVSHLLMSEKYLLLVERNLLSVYSYDGRLTSSPKWATLSPSSLNPNQISISSDTIAIRDQIDEKTIQIVDITGKEMGGPVVHTTPVSELELSQAGTTVDRLLALVDKNRDLYIATILAKPGQPRKIEKLGNIIESFKWNANYNIIAAMQDTSLTIWYYPNVLFVDRSLTRKTMVVKDASEFGRSPSLVNFIGNQVNIRRSDGALVTSPISAHAACLYQRVMRSQWKQALRICRIVKENFLWACLAAMATHAKNLEAAEMAYAAINAYDKVIYIQHIKGIPVRTVQVAEMYLLGGNVSEAEAVLLQNGLVFRAIWSNINAHKWLRALEIALRHKVHIDTVLSYRRRYLESFEKSETNEKFLQAQNQIKVDDDLVDKKVSEEFSKEQHNNSDM